MFTARSKPGITVTARDAEKANKPFYCPNCESEVTLRRGYVRLEHFAHMAASSCEYAKETELHIQMKLQIFKNLSDTIGSQVKSIQLEKPLGIIRPDIYIEGKKKNIGIEVQASALTPEQIISRTKFYFSKGIYVLWVVPYDEKRFYKYNNITNRMVLSPFRVKEYERIICQMYFKTMILWDIERDPENGFMAFKISDCYTEGTEFYDRDYGELRSFAPRKQKTMKLVDSIQPYLELGDLQPKIINSFSMSMAGYDLPKRNLMIYNWLK
jgi:competence CoiA-like predicted nuclease